MHRPATAILFVTALAVAAAAPSAGAAAMENPLAHGPWLDARGVLTTESGDVMDARLQVRGADGNLTLDSADGSATLASFTVEWTKARTAPHQTAAWTLTITADTALGALILTGTWTAASVAAVCTLSYPNTCTWHAAGPATLQGTLGGDAVTLAGVAHDTYCTQGHLPGNVHMPCGEAWPLA